VYVRELPLADRFVDHYVAAGIPTVTDAEFADAVFDLSERRRQLLGIVEADAWHWPPIDS